MGVEGLKHIGIPPEVRFSGNRRSLVITYEIKREAKVDSKMSALLTWSKRIGIKPLNGRGLTFLNKMDGVRRTSAQASTASTTDKRIEHISFSLGVSVPYHRAHWAVAQAQLAAYASISINSNTLARDEVHS